MSQPPASPTRIAAYGLAGLNLLGIVALAWFVGYLLYYDGVMQFELSLCAAAAAFLAATMGGGLYLERRGYPRAGIVVLAIGALPVLAATGFILYLQANPIDWK